MTENCRVKIARLRGRHAPVALFLLAPPAPTFVTRICSRLSASVERRPVDSAARSPLTICPFRVRPTQAYVVIVRLPAPSAPARAGAGVRLAPVARQLPRSSIVISSSRCDEVASADVARDRRASPPAAPATGSSSACRAFPGRPASCRRSGGSCRRGSGCGWPASPQDLERRDAALCRSPSAPAPDRRCPRARARAACGSAPAGAPGNASMMRVIVCAAELVCSVAIVKWPVSASFSAASIVSRSRISPTSTTSGSSRRAARSAMREALRVGVQLALVDQARSCAGAGIRSGLRSSGCAPASARLIRSIIAASVVDLPLPVGPVTSTRPRGRSASSASTGGRPELLERADLLGNQTEDGADGALLVEDVAAEPADAAQAEGQVELPGLFELLLLRVGQHAVGQRLDDVRRQVRIARAAADGRPRAPGAASPSTGAGPSRPARASLSTSQEDS